MLKLLDSWGTRIPLTRSRQGRWQCILMSQTQKLKGYLPQFSTWWNQEDIPNLPNKTLIVKSSSQNPVSSRSPEGGEIHRGNEKQARAGSQHPGPHTIQGALLPACRYNPLKGSERKLAPPQGAPGGSPANVLSYSVDGWHAVMGSFGSLQLCRKLC